ncbi:hypothetical protein [uncultured Mobiluncus sp.]|uniref:hypothetical protein n=1 Tax=uncultured Mobiluncus sp. TaxID=293425 RepID=UPI00288BDA7F|nr:hypothetical protein [uncultured Mobiluncus sp.]
MLYVTLLVFLSPALSVTTPGLVMQTLISGLAEHAESLLWLTLSVRLRSSTCLTHRLPETLNQARPAL